MVSLVMSCIRALSISRSSAVETDSGAVRAMTVVTDLNLREASSSTESTRYASAKHIFLPRFLSWRKRLSSSTIFRSAGPGNPSQCRCIAFGQLTPVNIVAWPVADWGGPSMPRQASIGFE